MVSMSGGIRVAMGNYVGDEEGYPDFSFTVSATVEKYGAFTNGGNLVTSGSDPNETFFRVTWGGKTSTTVSPRDKVLSDPVDIAVPQGGYLYVRTYCTIPVGGYEHGLAVSTASTTAFGEAAEGGTGALADKTGGGQIATTRLTGPVCPVAVVGTPDPGVTEHRRVAIIGDSIAYGLVDTQNISYCERALTNAGIPHYHTARSTSAAGRMLDAQKGLNRREIAQDATSMLCEYGANDIRGGASGAAAYLVVQQTYMALWQQLATTGLVSGTRPVWQTTVLPTMTSAAPSATPIGGSTGGTTSRAVFNDWVRAGGVTDGSGVPVVPGTPGAIPWPYLTGTIDTADAVEADASGVLARNGGWYKDWTVNTGEGLHPTDAGHLVIAAAIAARMSVFA
jgi:lysophospholipase L1-like esterase